MPRFLLSDKWHEGMLDLLFPRRCTGCGRSGTLLCSDCVARLRPLGLQVCPTCGLPLAGLEPCWACNDHALATDSIRSVYHYEPPLREVIIAFKYQRVRALGDTLAALLAAYLEKSPFAPDVVVPVPLHPSRLSERGYNQAAVLAEAVGRLTSIACAPAALRRVRATPAQARLTRSERWANVEGAFQANADAVAGRAVLVLDDVCTTGATVDACAQALRQAGARQVWALTLARDV